MEEYFPTQSDKPIVGPPSIHGSSVALMAKSLVESQDGFVNGEERNDDAMEDLPGRFSNASLVRIGQTREPKGKDDNGRATTCNQLAREYGDNENDPSVHTNQGDSDSSKLACNIRRAKLGHFGRNGMGIDLTVENNAASR